MSVLEHFIIIKLHRNQSVGKEGNGKSDKWRKHLISRLNTPCGKCGFGGMEDL